MTSEKRRPALLAAMVAFLFFAAAAATFSQTTKPITYKGLLNSLKTHGLTNPELTQIIKTRGVDFELTADKESDLKAAGADADLLAAVRVNLRGAGAAAPARWCHSNTHFSACRFGRRSTGNASNLSASCGEREAGRSRQRIKYRLDS